MCQITDKLSQNNMEIRGKCDIIEIWWILKRITLTILPADNSLIVGKLPVPATHWDLMMSQYEGKVGNYRINFHQIPKKIQQIDTPNIW